MLMIPYFKNLAPDYDAKGVYRRVGAERLRLAGAWEPGTIVPTSAGAAVVVTAANQIGLLLPDDSLRTITIDEAPTAVLAVGDTLAAMTATGRHLFTVGSDGTLLPASDPAQVPAGIALRAAYNPPVSVYVGGVKLSKSYASERTLAPADERLVTAHAADIYCALDSAARSSGSLIFPAVAMLDFCRADGSVAFSSAPALISPGEDCRGCRIKLLSSDSQTVGEGRFYATSCKVHVEIPQLDMPDIARARLIVSPLMQAAQPDADSALVSTLGTISDAFCAVTFPASISATFGGGGTAGCAAALAAALRARGTVAASIPVPFASGFSGSVDVSIPGSPSSDEAALHAIMNAAATVRPADNLAMLLAPNSFTAAAVAQAGSTVLWAGLRAVPFRGFAPEAFLSLPAGTGRRWEAYVAVSLDDGSRLVRSSSGTCAATGDAAVLPLITYPSAHATSVEIGLKLGTAAYRSVMPLSAEASGTMAAYSPANLLPFSLDAASDYTVPAQQASTSELPGVVAAAPASEPFAVSATERVGAQTAISAVVAARFSASSWDFGRSRFFIFGSSAMFSATVNAARTVISIGDLDPRGVASGRAVVRTPEGILALAGSDVVQISGTQLRTVAHDVDAAALLYDFERHELWCLHSFEAAATVLCPRASWSAYRRTLPSAARAALSVPGCSSFAAADGIYAISGGSGPLAVEYRGELPAPRGAGLRFADVDICGTAGTEAEPMTVTVSRLRRNSEPWRIAATSYRGEIKAPVRIPFMVPAPVSGTDFSCRSPLLLRVAGPAGEDFSLKISR